MFFFTHVLLLNFPPVYNFSQRSFSLDLENKIPRLYAEGQASLRRARRRIPTNLNNTQTDYNQEAARPLCFQWSITAWEHVADPPSECSVCAE